MVRRLLCSITPHAKWDGVNSLDQRRPSDGGVGGTGRLLLAALTVLMALTGAFFLLPLLFITPAPLAALVYRYGYRSGIITAVFTLVLVGSGQQRILGAVAATLPEQSWHAVVLVAMTALVTIGLIGIVIGGAWREGVSRWQTLWLSTAASLLPALAVWSVVRFVQDIDLLQVVFDSWSQMMRALVEQSAAGGLPRETADGLLDMLAESEQAFPLVKALLPGMLFNVALVGSYVNSGLAGYVLNRSDRRPPPFAPFVTWRLPWPFAIAFVLGHALLLTARVNGSAVTAIVGQNLLIATGFVFAVQGIAIVVGALQRRRVGAVVRLLAVIVLLWWAPVVPTWMGVLDTWFNFRKLPSGPVPK